MDMLALLRERRDGLLLKGCVDMCRVTGDQTYRQAVLEAVDAAAPDVSRAKALFFAWDETGEERHKTAAVNLMNELKAAPLPMTARGLYDALPFLAECDTRFGDKQTYKLIARHCAAYRAQSFDPETRLYRPAEAEGWVLMALVDTAEKIDEHMYEHYRAVADQYFEAIRGWLDSGEQADAMAVYALLKGVRLGLLDDEKYLPIALQLASEAKTENPGLRLMIDAEIKEVKQL